MSTPLDWMSQTGNLFKLWTEQQQVAFKTMAETIGPFGAPGKAAPAMSADLPDSLRQAQTLWQSSMDQWVALAKQSLPGSGNADAALRTLFDPGQWQQQGLGPLDQAIEHLVDGPSYATLWTLDRKLLKAQKLRAEWAKDLAAYQVFMHTAWSEAVKRFLQAINDAQGAPIKSWRELTDVWIDVANATLIETHRTPEFLEIQRRLTRSGTECRLQEREIAEAYCEMQQLPTRTEVDELQHAVYELRRALRRLERGSATSRARTEKVKPAPAPPRKRSTASKPKSKRRGAG